MLSKTLFLACLARADDEIHHRERLHIVVGACGVLSASGDRSDRAASRASKRRGVARVAVKIFDRAAMCRYIN